MLSPPLGIQYTMSEPLIDGKYGLIPRVFHMGRLNMYVKRPRGVQSLQ